MPLDIAAFEEFQPALHIKHISEETIVPFHPNPNQRKAHAAYQKQINEGLPLRVISVKSRRTGFSRDALAIGFAHLLSTPNTNGHIAAHRATTGKELFEQESDWYKSWPIKLGKSTMRELRFPHSEGASKLTWGTAKDILGGRGKTNSFLLISEAAYIGLGAFMSLLSTVSKKDPNSIIFVESTANGKVGDGEPFYRYWEEAAHGESPFIPMFMGWLEDPECKRPAKEASDAPATDLERELMKDFGATKAQIAWMRWTLKLECNGLEDVFQQEYAWTPDVAFLSTGSPAFTRSEMKLAQSTVQQPVFKGHLFRNGKLNPEPADRRREEYGPWRVWKWPEPGHFYYLGGDSARGEEGHDYAACCIWDGITGEQCASYKGHATPDEFAMFLHCAGQYWRHGLSPGLLLCELTGETGANVQVYLRDGFRWGSVDFPPYSNLYRWKGARNDRPKGAYGMSTMGWEMTERSRRRALVQFRTDLMASRLTVRDEALVRQIEIAQKGGAGTYDWQIEEDNDDLFCAAILGWVNRCDMPPPAMAGFIKKPEGDGQDRIIKALETEESGFGFLVQTAKHLDKLGLDFNRPAMITQMGYTGLSALAEMKRRNLR